MIVIRGMGSAGMDEADLLEKEHPRINTRRMPAYVRAGLLAALRAAGGALPEDAGIAAGSSYGCQKMSCDFMDSVINAGAALASPLPFSLSVNNAGAALIGQALGITGPAFTINKRGRSLEGAIQTAVILLRSGRLSSCLAGVIEEADERLARLGLPQASPGSFFLFLQNA